MRARTERYRSRIGGCHAATRNSAIGMETRMDTGRSDFDREVIRSVDRFAKDALASYIGNRKKTADLYALVNAWATAQRADERKILGKRVLGLLNVHGVEDPGLVREVLQYVGTPICTCKDPDAWKAVTHFLRAGHLLSVNLAALEAASRLLSKPAKGSRREIPVCKGDLDRLQGSPSPEVRSMAKQVSESSAAFAA